MTIRERFELIDCVRDSQLADLAREVRNGLNGKPKTLPCRFFYDQQGSVLFEAISRLPEYYLTRVELDILRRRAPDLARRIPGPIGLVELGSGSATKTRILIQAFLEEREILRYVPVDISRDFLRKSCRALLDEYPKLEILAIAGEYEEGLRYLGGGPDFRKVILWLGSNVGNLDRPEAGAFLRDVPKTMSSEDRLVIGIDMRKDRNVLERAYDDSAGVTAEFNRNILVRINRELGGNFDLAAFDHRAIYDDKAGRVEMYLVSTRAQDVRIENLDLEIEFAPGEAIHTENSYKYSPEEIDELAAAAGMGLEAQWFDDERRFSVNLLCKA